MLFALMLLQDPVASAVEKLQSDRIELREEGVRELALLGDAAAHALQALVADPDPELAGRARRALEMNRRTSALPRTLAARQPALLERDVPLAELLALPLSREEEAFFAPRAVLALDLPPARWYLIVRGRVPAAPLARAVRDGRSPTLRAYALAALQGTDRAEAVRIALTFLRSPSVELRIQAAFTLGEAGPATAAAELKPMLRDEHRAARDAAALAIRRLAPRADVPAVPVPEFSRADALSIFAAAPRAKDDPTVLDWYRVPGVTVRRGWFEDEIVYDRRIR